MQENRKIGFIIDSSHKVPAWYAETLRTVISQKLFSIHFIELPAHEIPGPPFFYRVFRKFEQWWFRSAPDAARLESIEHLIKQAEISRLLWDQNFLLNSEELQKLKNFGLDLIYTVDFHDGTGENISQATPYGLWYINLGRDKNPQDAAGLKEVMENNPVTTSQLVMRRQEQETVLYDGSTVTVPFSVKNNFNAIAWKASSYLPFRLAELAGSKNFISDHQKKPDYGEPAGYPLNSKMPLLFLKNVWRYLFHSINKKINEGRFTLLYSDGNFDLNNLAQLSFRPFPLPRGVFYADPFTIEHNGKVYVFFEAYDPQKSKAHISLMEMDVNRNFCAPKKILEEPFHLSYPFVFFHDQQYYMIPETAANKTVSLYRARKFPDEWEFVMYLMEGRELVDVTLHFENGKWWMFATGRYHPFVSTNDQLFLFYSENLLSGNWTPHIQNPIATRIENCRPAGRIFRYNNKFYRPAQDNGSFQYGYGIRINEIEQLDENSYREKEIYSIKPESLGLKACHHLEISSQLIFIDGIVK